MALVCFPMTLWNISRGNTGQGGDSHCHMEAGTRPQCTSRKGALMGPLLPHIVHAVAHAGLLTRST